MLGPEHGEIMDLGLSTAEHHQPTGHGMGLKGAQNGLFLPSLGWFYKWPQTLTPDGPTPTPHFKLDAPVNTHAIWGVHVLKHPKIHDLGV